MKKNNFVIVFLVHCGIQILCAQLFRAYLILNSNQLELQSTLAALALSLVFDFALSVYTFFPFLILLIRVPMWFSRKINKSYFILAFLFADLFIALMNLNAEFLFFEEFRDRFNFIAVDYLVYSNEVLQNILESYNVGFITFLCLIFAALGIFFLNKFIFKEIVFSIMTLKKITGCILAYGALFATMLYLVNENSVLSKQSDQTTLLAKNGIHSLFAAFRNNEINFQKFYSEIDTNLAFNMVKQNFYNESSDFNKDGVLPQFVQSTKPIKKLNVIIILMESMSAKFMKSYGNEENLTPTLDRLVSEGLFFHSAFATGTRTVRGIEAITLSIPPTPGQSIVRRPNGTGLRNISTVFKKYDYESKFIYGGYSFFDNMKPYFEGNGFEVVDRNAFKVDEIAFSNAWGVSDEDLFKKAIKESDKSFDKNKPFFSLVLTASNHRPYTFPEGQSGAISGRGRSDAVKYSDFAIEKFMMTAKRKKWFDSTMFVFISDHNASVAGGEKIEIEDYRIPIIFYSPTNLKPQKVEDIVSQIDLAPTLFGLLNFSYESYFFDVDVLAQSPNRAFIGTYQKVGYFDQDDFVILSPNKILETGKVINFEKHDSKKMIKSSITVGDSEVVKTAAAYYRLASDFFNFNILKVKKSKTHH